MKLFNKTGRPSAESNKQNEFFYDKDYNSNIVTEKRLDNLRQVAERDRQGYRLGLRALLEETAMALDYKGLQAIKNYFGVSLIRESPLYIDILNQFLLQMSRTSSGTTSAKDVFEFVVGVGDVSTLDIITARQKEIVRVTSMRSDNFLILKKKLQDRLTRIEKHVENYEPAELNPIYNDWID